MLILTWTLSAKDGSQSSGNWTSHVSEQITQNSSAGEFDALAGPIVLYPKGPKTYNSRNTADTLSLDEGASWSGQFIQSPGDGMLVAYQMPADGILRGVNIPVYEWGSGDQELMISVHKLSYPINSEGSSYSGSIVDGDGWIGGYDMAADGSVSMTGTNYTPDSTDGICEPLVSVATGARDPLGDVEGFGPIGVPTKGLLWPDGATAVTMTPATHGDYAADGVLDNWISMSDFGSEPSVLQGDWIGIFVQYVGEGGGDDEPTGFFYAEGAGLVSTWNFMKFYAGCGGTSGNGGWHIRHWSVRFNLAVELTGDRGPIISGAPKLGTTLSTEPISVTVKITDDNPSGGDAGLDGAPMLHVYPQPSHAYQAIPMTATVGDSFTADIPGFDPGTNVSWWITAADVGGNESETVMASYNVFLATTLNLYLNNGGFSSGWAPYYMNNTNIPYDIWTSSEDGIATAALLNNYDGVYEITQKGPAQDNRVPIKEWFDQGNKQYILSGDEVISWWTSWEDVSFVAGDFSYDVLGVSAVYNDINGTKGVT